MYACLQRGRGAPCFEWADEKDLFWFTSHEFMDHWVVHFHFHLFFSLGSIQRIKVIIDTDDEPVKDDFNDSNDEIVVWGMLNPKIW